MSLTRFYEINTSTILQLFDASQLLKEMHNTEQDNIKGKREFNKNE